MTKEPASVTVPLRPEYAYGMLVSWGGNAMKQHRWANVFTPVGWAALVAILYVVVFLSFYR